MTDIHKLLNQIVSDQAQYNPLNFCHPASRVDEVKPVPVHLVKEGVVFEQIIFAGMAISVGLEKSIAVLIRPNPSIIKPVELALVNAGVVHGSQSLL
ncbi:hypothetical protein H6G00_20315 [Leptolyngbya sp. FACHB-541]|uniref:hypothetical protein n=1 Tax=Leptolyngbya sp. FACHB-541 TaxID=2692810 RepID=UPI001688A6C5|nr:hypothetical protein [Leptolyngbya sp. FACHB-541]MBD1998928.1 hypothetical protein [Leptolyngbya sp. FACHB-541]